MIAVVVPTYNEKENIGSLVKSILNLNIKEIKIFIVDDNSPDGTGKIIDQLSRKHKNKIKPIHRTEKGRASAGIRGFNEALKENPSYVIEMDADFSHDPKQIPIFLKEIKNCDVVVGSRYVGAGRIEERGISRNIISTFANFYNRLLLRIDVRDVSGGYKCYRADVLRSIKLNSFVSSGYSIGAELLYRIKKKGYRVKEVPINFADRAKGRSKFNKKQMFNYFLKVLQIRFSSRS